MKKSSAVIVSVLVFSILAITLNLTSCKKEENPIKFPMGTFPDSTFLLADINSAYNDFEVTNIPSVLNAIDPVSHILIGNIISVISTDRNSAGVQADLVQGILTFEWDQKTGLFGLGTDVTQNAFLTKLINAANTSSNDVGPYRLFSSEDGFEYMILSSLNTNGDLDYYFLKNQPVFGNASPAVLGPYPINLLNTDSDDAYFSFNLLQDTAYFSSASDSNFDIYLKKKPLHTDLATWFSGTYSASEKVDSINSPSEDKCPCIFKKLMVFASDRPGGLGGFDLYYSIFRNGKWSSAKNMGPDINTSNNEYRPIIGGHREFTNNFLIFSSDRPGGKGGYDLYFKGVTFPE